MKRVLRVGNWLLFLFWTLGIYQTAVAQPTFYVQDQTVVENTVIEVPVRVTNFRSILGLQFSMSWDAEVLEYVGLEQLALTLTPENFGTVSVENGILVISYIDMALQGVDLPDNAVFFAISFRPVADAGNQSQLAFTNTPAVQEVTDTSQQAVAASYEDGMIAIVDATSATADVQAPLHISEVHPNPFSDATRVSWQQARAGNTTWQLYNQVGQLIASDEAYYTAGQHQLSFTKKDFPGSGSYILRVQHQNYTITEKLVYVEP